MDKVLELTIRATIQYLDGNMAKFNEYKNKAMKLQEEMDMREVYKYPIRSLVSEEVEEKLHDLVN